MIADWREATYNSYFLDGSYQSPALIDTIGGKILQKRDWLLFVKLDATFYQDWFAAGRPVQARGL